MAETPTLYASGTQTCVIGTEHFLSSPNVAGVFGLEIDKINMAAADVLEVRVYKIILTGGTTRVCYLGRYADAQPVDDLITVTPLVGNDLTDTNSLRFSILQTKGTGRNVPWKLLSY